MIRSISISSFQEVKTLCNLARDIQSPIAVHDFRGSTADAKSMLGLMSLDYSKPVDVVCEDEALLNLFVRAIDCHGDYEAMFRLMNPSFTS